VGLFSGWSDPDDDGGDDGEGSSPWEGRGFIASAIVVGALVVCVLVWFFASANGGDTPATQPSVPPATTAPTDQPTEQPTQPVATPTDEPTSTPGTPPPPVDAAGGCKAKNVDQKPPKVAPAAVTWLFDAQMLIPLQPQAGPASQDSDGLRHCYAHSPTGAVLAAMVTLAQLRNPALSEAVLQRRTTGPGRSIALKAAKSPPTPGDTTAQPPQFTGFKILDYQANRAIIAIAVRTDVDKVASLPVTMAWSSSDWKMVLQVDGSINGDAAPDLLASLDGYVRFGGA
jgi:hypothetical protein